MTATRAHSPRARANDALARGDWAVARAAFREALDESETADVYEGLSWAALELNDGECVIHARQHAYRLYREAGDDVGAARMAMWLGKDYEDFEGEPGVARGWRQRARRLLDGRPVSPEHGWLPLLECWASLAHGEEPKAVQSRAGEAIAVSRECGDPDIEIVALAMEGLALVGEGRVEDGMTRLDEAATAVLGGELDVEHWGLAVFCFLIQACERVWDFERAARWCVLMRETADRMGHTGSQGICRAHYGAVLTWCGEWADAEAALAESVSHFEASWPPQRAEALVRLAALRRRQGRGEEAAHLLRSVEWHPRAMLGLAEMALDDGRLRDGEELVERFLRRVPSNNRLERAAGLEILARVAALSGQQSRAAAVIAELEAVADVLDTLPLRGATCFSKAVLALELGDPEGARACFEDAVDVYARSGAPYEAARARLELASVLGSLHRHERAREEAMVARDVMERLGAASSARRAETILTDIDRRAARRDDGPCGTDLTPRQVEILRLVTQGLSNREIAETLGVSEHTVHRHVANILLRLDVSTRAAAVAQAVSRGLV